MNASSLRTAWLVVALLVPVALLNYLDRQMLASMKSSVMGDVMLGRPEADWGLILALFKWTYASLIPMKARAASSCSYVCTWPVNQVTSDQTNRLPTMTILRPSRSAT